MAKSSIAIIWWWPIRFETRRFATTVVFTNLAFSRPLDYLRSFRQPEIADTPSGYTLSIVNSGPSNVSRSQNSFSIVDNSDPALLSIGIRRSGAARILYWCRVCDRDRIRNAVRATLRALDHDLSFSTKGWLKDPLRGYCRPRAKRIICCRSSLLRTACGMPSRRNLSVTIVESITLAVLLASTSTFLILSEIGSVTNHTAG